MGDFGSWLQDNWYDLGTLLAFLGFVIAGVWFARKFLKTLAAFQEQIGALLKFSLLNASERPVKNPSAKDALAEGISSWLQTPPTNSSGPVASSPNGLVLAGSRLFAWLQASAHAFGTVPLRRMVRWFQAPIGS